MINFGLLAKEIKKVSSGKIHLYGYSLRELCINGDSSVIYVNVQEKNPLKRRILRETLREFDNCNLNLTFISFEKIFMHEHYLLDYIYAEIDENTTGVINVNYSPHYSTMRYLKNGIVSLSPRGLRRLNDPFFVLQTLKVAARPGFVLEYNTLDLIIKNINCFDNADKFLFSEFLKKMVSFKSNKQIKYLIKYLNATKISVKFFGCHLNIPHFLIKLKRHDHIEFLTLLFRSFDDCELRDRLKYFSPSDVSQIEMYRKCLDLITEESELVAKNIIAIIGRKRANRFSRILVSLSLNTLKNYIRKKKYDPIYFNEFCVNEDDLKNMITIRDDDHLKEVIDMVTQFVRMDKSNNNSYKIYNYLIKKESSV